MKKLTILFALLGCIASSSHAWWDPPYDRSFNPRSSEFTPCTIVPADSTLTTVFDGIEMSAMDYAEIQIMHSPIDKYKQADYYIVGYGPSPRLKSLDKSSTVRQKLIIADNPFYTASFDKPFEYTFHKEIKINPPEHVRLYYFPDCMADNLTYDFDLSEYACDFDIYIILHTSFVFDNAFSNFNYSDNIKSVNIYLIGCHEIGHEAFSSFKNIESVDVRLMAIWSFLDYYNYSITDISARMHVYSDSFAQETYSNAMLETFLSESSINELLTNTSANNYNKNIYRFFNRRHSGIENTTIKESPVEYMIRGRNIVFTNLTPHETVCVYTLTGSSVGNYVADDYGALNIDVRQPGVYLISVNSTTYKIIIY